eukprot:scaffold357870_cov15-Prasinocladus_malaysianus.AAC.1
MPFIVLKNDPSDKHHGTVTDDISRNEILKHRSRKGSHPKKSAYAHLEIKPDMRTCKRAKRCYSEIMKEYYALKQTNASSCEVMEYAHDVRVNT